MLLMGKLTISMAIFNSYVSHYQRVSVSHYQRLYHDLSYKIPFENP